MICGAHDNENPYLECGLQIGHSGPHVHGTETCPECGLPRHDYCGGFHRPGDGCHTGNHKCVPLPKQTASVAIRKEPRMHDAELGVRASVYCDRNDSAPRTLLDEERADLRDVVAHYFEDFNVVSIYTLQVALWALQNPTPENIAKALRVIGTSGDVEEHVDDDTLLPLPVPEPSWPYWERA